jgi:phosphoglycolate phosphatase-like HAD superfamily hydrolase
MLPRPPRLVIFDKDGTLIDFQRMWGYWAGAFAERISQQIAVDVRHDVLHLYGVDPHSLRIDPQGALSISPMATMQQMVVRHIMPYCSDMAQAYQIVQQAWQPPDPTMNVHPLADLPLLFGQLRQLGVLIAVATADNRQPTVATLTHLGVGQHVAAFACADDPHMPPKPAPDKIWAVCQMLDVHPHDAIMIGDTPADMQMGRNAGVMAQIGVTSGVSTADELQPWASWVMATIADVWHYWPRQ